MFSSKRFLAGRRIGFITGCALLSAIFAVRADDKQTQSPAAEPPTVQVARPVEREVTDYEMFNGRVEAAESVNIASRVTGYLTKVAFKEGSDVKKGDLLFEIDPRQYQAQVDQAEAEVRLAETRLKLAEADYQRAQELIKSAAISQAELAKLQAAREDAQAGVATARPNLEAHQLMLSFCKITSPIDGRIGRANITPGNLVKQDDTVLTTVVSVEPICVSFDIDEHTWLRLARLVAAGGKGVSGAALPVFVQATDENGFPHEGTVTFVSNQFNPSTGTISARATLPNVPMAAFGQIFLPGMFVRARIPVGPPHRAILVSDVALHRSNGFPSVSIVVDDDSVESRKVAVGQLQDDGLRVIGRGLKPGDRVVVEDVGPNLNAKIRPQLVPMPTNDTNKKTPTSK
jgi:RND family efflux transporter MFP subunit